VRKLVDASAVSVVTVLVALMTAHAVAHAALITSSATRKGRVIVSLDGEIVGGDADKLTTIIKSANAGRHFVSSIRLNSPGGVIAEGVKLASIVRYGRIATVVPNGDKCASACFIVFAAGDPKYVSYGAFVGVHGASDEAGRETVEAGAATVSMARIVKDLGVPAPIIGKMVVTPPDQIVWLTPEDLRSMGTTMTGRPQQTPPAEIASPQTSPQTSPNAPMQLDPYAKAAVPPPSDSSQPPTWNSFVQNAITISARQNGGKPQMGRSCQPELKICNMAIFFKYKGHDVMVRRAEDANGDLVRRDFCEFNDFGDIRTCIDWDSGKKTREMKDSKGEWVSIGN
jgi:hypothetical protein